MLPTKIKSLIVSVVLGAGLLLGLTLTIQAAPGDVYCVTPGGGTFPACTQVFTTIQAAVDAASGGEEIRVAAGTYTDLTVRSGVTQVVYLDKGVTLRGGYTAANWATSDPETNPTILDAQGQGRVMYITGTINPVIESLTLTQGDATGQGGDPTGDAGGGVYIINATVTFSTNRVISNTTGNAGLGGGIYLRNGNDSLIQNNEIRGNGNNVGVAGGVYVGASSGVHVIGNDISENKANPYPNPGGGGSIGGVGFFDSPNAILRQNTIEANRARHNGGFGFTNSPGAIVDQNIVQNNIANHIGGGQKETGAGGIGFSDNIIITSNTFRGNRSADRAGALRIQNSLNAIVKNNRFLENSGGSFGFGSSAIGGALYVHLSEVSMENNLIKGNVAYGTGSGLYFWSSVVHMQNNVIVDNRIIHSTPSSGGQGAAVYLASSTVDMRHTTIARNTGHKGVGIHVAELFNVPSQLSLTNTILVSQTIGVSITAVADSSLSIDSILWHNNGQNYRGNGTISVVNEYTGDPGFQEDGYHLKSKSEAINRGINAQVNSDIDGDPRPAEGGIDLGADERVNLYFDKTVSQATALPGEIVTYQISLSTIGSPETVALTDTLPAGLTYVDGSLSSGATHTNGQIHFVGDVEGGQPVAISYQARVGSGVPPGTTLYNNTEVTWSGRTQSRSVGVSVQDISTQPIVILIYANGDNDLAHHIQDLAARAQIGAVNQDIVVWMVVDWPERNSYLYHLGSNIQTGCNFFEDHTCGGAYVENQTVWAFSEDLGRPENLTEFVTGAINAYPNAEQVLLSLVGHGGGWSPNVLGGQPTGHDGLPGEGKLGGLLWDQHPGNSLSTPGLGKALRQVFQVTNRKIDLLYLDACLMGMWEVAYEIQDSVRYLLASESWSWTSFTYDAHLRRIRSGQDAVQIGQMWMENEADLLRRDNYPFTLGLVDLNQMRPLREKIDTLAAALVADLTANKARIKEAFLASDCFDSNQNHVLDDRDTYCDLLSFARQLETRFGSQPAIVDAAKGVQSAVEGAVVAEDHHNGIPGHYSNSPWVWGNLGGLSIYLPLHPNLEDPAHCQSEQGEFCEGWKRRYYHQMLSSKDGGWDDLIDTYWDNAEAPLDPACPPDCDLPPGHLDTDNSDDDLLAYQAGLWTTPVSPRAGQATQLSLLVHRVGATKTLTDVLVHFYDGHPDRGGTLLGHSTIPFLPPNGLDSPTPIIWTPAEPGIYHLYAVIDPNNQIPETSESNNRVNRPFLVLSTSQADQTPPTVDQFLINDGASQTMISAVTLDTVASDPDPSSGLGRLYFVEYQYFQAVDLWAPVAKSGWRRYKQARTDYPWRLQETAGIKYIDAWAVDNDLNISLKAGRDFINHILPIDHISQGQARIYRYHLQANQRLQVQVTPTQGDPDLYVWPPDDTSGQTPWISDLATGVDAVDFVAPVAGIYQVEVHGFNTAAYSLMVEITDTVARPLEQSGGQSAEKEKRDQPFVSLSSKPSERFTPDPAMYLLHLPLMLR